MGVDVSYQPSPIDTSRVVLSADLQQLTERLAQNTHDNWAQLRLSEGWRLGPRRDELKKEHPCLIPFEQLPESEKEYDRQTAVETLKVILTLGYRIEKATSG